MDDCFGCSTCILSAVIFLLHRMPPLSKSKRVCKKARKHNSNAKSFDAYDLFGFARKLLSSAMSIVGGRGSCCLFLCPEILLNPFKILLPGQDVVCASIIQMRGIQCDDFSSGRCCFHHGEPIHNGLLVPHMLVCQKAGGGWIVYEVKQWVAAAPHLFIQDPCKVCIHIALAVDHCKEWYAIPAATWVRTTEWSTSTITVEMEEDVVAVHIVIFASVTWSSVKQ